MNLNEEQKKEVGAWLREGLKLSEIQKRIETRFGLNPTYMEVKLLVSDIDILPKDQPEVLPTKTVGEAPAAPGAAGRPGTGPATKAPAADALPAQAPTAGVSVKLDQITKPGAMASGSVTFSDGVSATWFLDQYGRLGLAGPQKGYQPPAADVQEFQIALENELAKSGL